ncbi:MAG: glycosyl hydrolase family 28-related protein, partial [Armatimonadota bacterium]
MNPVFVLVAALLFAAPAAIEAQLVVNVRDFGAKGDGTTDDTAAFQAALDSIADKGGTVSVPAGTYLIKTHLRIPNDVTLEGVWQIPTCFRA